MDEADLQDLVGREGADEEAVTGPVDLLLELAQVQQALEVQAGLGVELDRCLLVLGLLTRLGLPRLGLGGGSGQCGGVQGLGNGHLRRRRGRLEGLILLGTSRCQGGLLLLHGPP